MASPRPSKQPLPTKWLVAIFVLLGLYALVQPALNSRLGWQLPSVTSLLTEQEAGPANGDAGSNSRGPRAADDDRVDPPANASRAATRGNTDTSTGTASTPPAESTGDAARSAGQVEPASAAGGEELKYGLLREIRRDVYLSAGGLQYGPGSAEGHRLKHVERHLVDQPNRPGKHGVFYGDMPQVLRWLDDAYQRAQDDAPGTRREQEGSRSVLEARFDKPIGYEGGRTGKSRNRPEARWIRLVVEGNKVITAFPFAD